MRPIRIGCSWARTSLPPRLTLATVAAEFFRSVLRDVAIVIVPSLACRSVKTVGGQYLEKVFASQRTTRRRFSKLPMDAAEQELEQGRSAAHAAPRPGRPASTTNDLAVVTGAPGVLICASVRKSACQRFGVTTWRV